MLPIPVRRASASSGHHVRRPPDSTTGRFPARVSIVFAAQVLTLSALVAVACWLDLDRGRRGAFLVAGVLAVAITIVFGRWTDRALRADLRARR
jgi:hypothetical protein